MDEKIEESIEEQVEKMKINKTDEKDNQKFLLTEEIVNNAVNKVLSNFKDVKHIKIKEVYTHSNKKPLIKSDNFYAYTNAYRVRFKVGHLKCKAIVSQYKVNVSCLDLNNINNTSLSDELKDQIGHEVLTQMRNLYGDEYKEMVRNTWLAELSAKIQLKNKLSAEIEDIEQDMQNFLDKGL